MKIILITLLVAIFTTTQAQYSNYYNVDVNANIKKDVNVNGDIYEHKTITTIDYGALQLANAQREKNRLESIKYADEQQRRISLEVATDPVKAYDYGTQRTFTIKGKDAEKYGFKKYTMSYRMPHNSMFVQAGAGRYENVSVDGITTEILINGPVYNLKKSDIDIEKISKMDSIKVGAINEKIGIDGKSIYVQKKDIRRTNVYGIKGYCATLIWEDDYQYGITDNYRSYNKNEGSGIIYSVKVRYCGDKDKVTFEQLEGRKYYLKLLIEKVISTAVVVDMKY